MTSSCHETIKMILQVTLLGTTVVKNVIIEWFLLFMNHFKILLQVTLLGAAVMTNVTYECFFSHELIQLVF